jgi:RNA polymerase sigma factor (sigma-70 family)
MNDWELLQDYARHGSEAAFQTLVERYLNLVHSVASRHVRDTQLAEEVCQAVFILMARKARTLKEGIVLSGWLFRTTRFVAARALRGEQRRQRREQEACEMQTLTTSDENWRRIEPNLDEALEHLGAADRNLLLLRFYEGRNHKEAGAALGLSEDAARKRGTRALERLRHWFAGRGIALSATVLAAALASNAVQAAPAGLAESVFAATGKATGATLPGLAGDTLNAWRLAKTKVTALWAGIGVGVALLIVPMAQHLKWQHDTAATGMAPQDAPSTAVANVASSQKLFDRRATASAKKRGGTLRLHVVAKDSGEPVAGARLAIVKVPNWEQTYDQSTDENGICDIELPANLGRLDVGVLSPGWGARFATWKRLDDDPIPAEYTLRVERVTNSVGGWIRDGNGKPVSGATIWLEFGGTGDASWRETPRERVGVMFEAPVATSDSEGHWLCAVIPQENPGFSLKAKHPDFAPTPIASSNSWSRVEQKDQETLQQLWAGTLVAKLGPALEIRGRVTDEKGEPLVAARVDHNPASSDALHIKTDTNGGFVIPKLKSGKYGLAVSAEGFAPEYREVDVQPGLEPLPIVLKPGAVLRLRLQDEAGTAVRGATVILEQWGQQRQALNWSAQTDDDGRIEWTSAPRDERLELCARGDGWCYTRGVIVTADGEEHTITMKPALTLDGYVTDAVTGDAIGSFKVFPGYGEGRGEQVWERGDTRQGLHGNFTLVFGESQQPWQLRVEAEGYEPFTSGPVPPDYLGRYEVGLKRADAHSRIRGVVLLPNGSPAAGASVALLTLDYGATLRPGSFVEQGYGNLAKADAAGHFTFVANARAHSVAAVSAAGFIKKRVRNPAEPVTLKLERWGTIEGTVAESLRVRPMEWLALEDDTTWNYHGSVGLDINAFQAKPDANGHFVFKQAPAGWFSLYINRRMGTPMSWRTPVEVRPGETTSVRIGGAGRTVTGQLILRGGSSEIWKRPETYAVLNPKGPRLPPPEKPNADEAGLWAVDFWQSQAGRDYSDRNRGFGLSVETNGFFEAEGVLPGAYELFVVAGGASLNKEVTIPEADLTEEVVVDLGTLVVAKH